MREKNDNSNCGGGREKSMYKYGRSGTLLVEIQIHTYIPYHSCIIKKKNFILQIYESI